MEIDESSKTIESTTPNMRNIFSNPQLNSTTERSASTEKSKTDSSQDKITAFLEFLNADFRTKEQIQEYLDVNIKCLYENSNFRHSYFNISAYLQIHRLELNEKKLQEKKPISENLKILKDEIIVEEQYSKNGLIEGIYRFLIPIASVAGLWILVITVILLFIEVISSLSKKYFK